MRDEDGVRKPALLYCADNRAGCGRSARCGRRGECVGALPVKSRERGAADDECAHLFPYHFQRTLDAVIDHAQQAGGAQFNGERGGAGSFHRFTRGASPVVSSYT